MKHKILSSIVGIVALLSPISAYATVGIVVDSQYDPISNQNSFTALGQSEIASILAQAITDGYGGAAFSWNGYYDVTTLSGGWGHGCGYNNNYGTPSLAVINISSTCIPAGGAEIPGHDTIYECITALTNGGPFYYIDAHGMNYPCIQYTWNGTRYVATPPLGNTTTHVVTTIPANHSIVATSTTMTVGGSSYINVQQYTEALAANNGHWFVQMTIAPASVVTGIPSAAGSFDAAFGTTVLTFPITSTGLNTYSTTTSITRTGQYNVTTQIIQPSPYNFFLTWLGFGSARTLAATSTSFTASFRTGFDILNASTTSIIDDYFASSSPALIASCASFTGFDLGDCLNLLFIPQSGDLSRVMNDLNSGLFQYAPFGYFTRVINILSGQATSSFPMMSTSFPNPSNPSQLMTYTFDQNEALAGAGTLLDNLTIPQDPTVNVRESMDLIVKTIIALSVVSYIFWDLAHSAKSGHAIKTKLS